MEQNYIQERRSWGWNQAALKGVSWGSIFAGAVMAIACQFVLSVLGIAIGFTTLDPATEANPLAKMGIGAILWWSLSMLASLYAGGWIAGRLAGIPRSGDGFFHGLLSWGVVTLVSLFMLTTAVGVTLGGVGTVLGRALGNRGGIAQGVTQAAQQIGGTPLGQRAGRAARDLQQNVRQTANLPPANLERQAREKGQEATRDLSVASFVSFIALLLGALAGGLGGRMGAPKSLLAPIPRGLGIAREPVASSH